MHTRRRYLGLRNVFYILALISSPTQQVFAQQVATPVSPERAAMIKRFGGDAAAAARFSAGSKSGNDYSFFDFGPYIKISRKDLDPEGSHKYTDAIFAKLPALIFNTFRVNPFLPLNAPQNQAVRDALDRWQERNADKLRGSKMGRVLLEQSSQQTPFNVLEAVLFLAVTQNLMKNVNLTELGKETPLSAIFAQNIDNDDNGAVTAMDTNTYRMVVSNPFIVNNNNVPQIILENGATRTFNAETIPALKALHAEMLQLRSKADRAELSNAEQARLAVLSTYLWNFFIFHLAWESADAIKGTVAALQALTAHYTTGGLGIIPREWELPRPDDTAVLSGIDATTELPTASLKRFLIKLDPQTSGSWWTPLLDSSKMNTHESGRDDANSQSGDETDDNLPDAPQRLAVRIQVGTNLEETAANIHLQAGYADLTPLAAQFHELLQMAVYLDESWSIRWQQYVDPNNYQAYYDELYDSFYARTYARDLPLPQLDLKKLQSLKNKFAQNPPPSEEAIVAAANTRLWDVTADKIVALNPYGLRPEEAITFAHAFDARKVSTSWFHPQTSPTNGAVDDLINKRIKSPDIGMAMQVRQAWQVFLDAAMQAGARQAPNSPLTQYLQAAEEGVKEEALTWLKEILAKQAKDAGKLPNIYDRPAYIAAGADIHIFGVSLAGIRASTPATEPDAAKADQLLIGVFAHPLMAIAREAAASQASQANQQFARSRAMQDYRDSLRNKTQLTGNNSLLDEYKTSFAARMNELLNGKATTYFGSGATTYDGFYTTDAKKTFFGAADEPNYPGFSQQLQKEQPTIWGKVMYLWSGSEIDASPALSAARTQDATAEISSLTSETRVNEEARSLMAEYRYADQVAALYMVHQGSAEYYVTREQERWKSIRNPFTAWAGLQPTNVPLLDENLTVVDASMRQIDDYIGTSTEDIAASALFDWTAANLGKLIGNGAGDLNHDGWIDQEDYEPLRAFIITRNKI